MRKEYLQLDKIEGAIVELSNIHDARYGEIVEVEDERGDKKLGRVIKIENERVIIQVFGSTVGMSTHGTKVRFQGKPFEIPLSKDILGRTFNGVGKPIDGGGEIYSKETFNINGRPINPVAREYPRDYIQTGISSIDGLITLIRGQKLPIFSASGLPHNELAAQIVRYAKIKSKDGEKTNFCIVFAAMGVKHDEAHFFRDTFEKSHVLDRVVMYVNYADDPIMERIISPRCALTAAEYLAFEKNMHVLVIMTDITSYGEALREISSLREEVPSRRGYPGYLYSDLASLYERAGMLKNKEGSITLIPILTMPNDDITHPIPDLTGYITEGQIVLSRELYQKNIYPPINVLPSLSRLMKDGIGEGFTRKDHPDVANQLFSSYSKVQEVRALAQIIGEDDLSDNDKKYLEFGRQFEEVFITQGFNENRDILDTLNLGWEILKILPKEELDRLDSKLIEEYLGK
ncbi:MAG: V-type ATP synthase beta chain [Sporanaerobacter sp.]|jgi:V/A-type H+/Na+-transporting ATPase subunit B|uniref:V-type ATP synthase subunit B n=1 Tax=Sporanaerobacter sp. TaxID=2010183 RepID=UPI003A10336D